MVFCCPVHGAAEPNDGFFHYGYVLVDDLFAELNKLSRRQVCFFDFVNFLSFDFCWKPMTVPALREQHVVASHALVAG